MLASLTNHSTGMPVLDAHDDFVRARRAQLAARALRWLRRQRRRPNHPRTLPETAARPARAPRLEVIPLASIVGTVEPSPHFDARFRPASAHGPNYAHLSTLMPDGRPHSVALWVGVEGERIAFLTSPGSRKARNLEHDARVAVSVTAHDQPFTMAAVQGRVAERLDGDAAWEVIDRISHKYTGRPYPLRTDRVVFLIEPERTWAQAYG